jgi:hypothetical protein
LRGNTLLFLFLSVLIICFTIAYITNPAQTTKTITDFMIGTQYAIANTWAALPDAVKGLFGGFFLAAIFYLQLSYRLRPYFWINWIKGKMKLGKFYGVEKTKLVELIPSLRIIFQELKENGVTLKDIENAGVNIIKCKVAPIPLFGTIKVVVPQDPPFESLRDDGEEGCILAYYELAGYMAARTGLKRLLGFMFKELSEKTLEKINEIPTRELYNYRILQGLTPKYVFAVPKIPSREILERAFTELDAYQDLASEQHTLARSYAAQLSELSIVTGEQARAIFSLGVRMLKELNELRDEVTDLWVLLTGASGKPLRQRVLHEAVAQGDEVKAIQTERERLETMAKAFGMKLVPETPVMPTTPEETKKEEEKKGIIPAWVEKLRGKK